MKQNLRIGVGYAPTRSNLKQRYIRYISLLAVLMTMCLYAGKQASAQQAEPAATAVADIKSLQIRDTIPEYLWNLPLQVVNHPEGKETIMLSEYRGKLIILDFWATWCGSCLRAFPKIDSLTQIFPKELTVLKVTYEPKTKDDVYTVVSDTVLRTVFPHRILPHFIWIGPEGEILAATGPKALAAANIRAALADAASLKPKIDRDSSKPLLSNVHLSDSMFSYAIFYDGMLDGYGTETIFRKAGGIVRGRCLVNRSIIELYAAAMIPLFDAIGDRYSYKRNYIPFELDNRRFSAEVVVPVSQQHELYPRFLRLLNESSPYWGCIKKRETECLVLRRVDNEKPLTSGGGKPQLKYLDKGIAIVNHPLTLLVTLLDGKMSFSTLPIVDETYYNENVDIQLADITSLPAIQKELKTYGLELTPSKRMINLFTLTLKP